MRKLLASPFSGAVLGGAIVAGVMLAAAGPSTNVVRTTIVEQQPLARDDGLSTGAVRDPLTPGEIYARDAPGVVYITATVVQQVSTPFSLTPTTERNTQTGSGFVINRDGVILTNAHVIDGAVKITVSFENNQTVAATVIGKDPDDDLALLHVNPDGVRLVPLPLGDSSTVRVGDPTAAIGNPFGLARTLSTGIVSALQRSIRAPNNFSIDNVIQTDAPINPGNSGGPLLNAQGMVIGINSQIYTGDGGGAIGIGFAIPINTAIAAIGQLRRTGRVSEGYLGISSVDVDPALADLHLGAAHGALIQTVASGSPAAAAGLRAGGLAAVEADGVTPVLTGGDIIVSVDGRAIAGASALEDAIVARRPGQVVVLGVVRGRRHLRVSVRLATRPNRAPSSG